MAVAATGNALLYLNLTHVNLFPLNTINRQHNFLALDETKLHSRTPPLCQIIEDRISSEASINRNGGCSGRKPVQLEGSRSINFDLANKMIAITVALLGVFLVSLYAYLKIRFKFADRIPVVEPLLPFFGNGLDFVQKNSYEIFANLMRAFQSNSNDRIFKLSFGPIAVICPTHPDLIQKVLNETGSMEKPYVYGFMRVDKGLLTANSYLAGLQRQGDDLNPSY